jgi:hypothetical protein
MTTQQLLRRRCHLDVNVNAVFQAVVSAAKQIASFARNQTTLDSKTRIIHDVVVEGFSELARHALQQFDVFPRKSPANFVLRVNNADKSVFPAHEREVDAPCNLRCKHSLASG